MLVDYYKILDIDYCATKEQIHTAYKKQARLWHPDKNPNIDTTRRMQDIVEAFYILGDDIKRVRYDAELRLLLGAANYQRAHNENNHTYHNHNVHNQKVEEDIEQAKKYAKSFINELKQSINKAKRGAWEEAQGYVYVAIAMTLIGLIAQTCG